MAIYDIPPGTDEKEKAIGGILTFGQFGWLLGAFGVGIISFGIIYMITRVTALGIIFGLPIAALGLPFAFYKKYDLSLLKYLRLKRKYKKQSKLFINSKGLSIPTKNYKKEKK